MEDFSSTSYAAAESTGSSWLAWIVFVALLVLVGAACIFVLIRRKRIQQARAFDMRAIQVTLPKLIRQDEEQRRDPKEIIAVMEPLFASIHHFYESKWWKKLWYGQPTFSFEIVTQQAEIFFYIVCPSQYMDQIERQVHAQYPSAKIDPTTDYSIFSEKGGESAIAAVGLLKRTIFPIRTYKAIENDPLEVLTNSLSKVGSGKAAIQVLVQPQDQSWHKGIEEALHNIQQGKSFNHQKTSGSKVLSFASEIGQTALATQKEENKTNEAHNTMGGNVRLTALQEQQAKLLVEKGSKLGFRVQIRCVARAMSSVEANSQLQNMLSAFAQFQSPESNGFKSVRMGNRNLLVDYLLRTFSRQQPVMILNTEELTSIFHLPNLHLDTPNIRWLNSRKWTPPTNLPKSGLLLGYSQFRGTDLPVYMNYQDRMRHFYMIGKSGSGKTAMFQNMILQDIRNGHGVCYMDPNGDAIEWILNHIPKERAEDVILFDPADTERPMAMNLLEYDPKFPEQKSTVVNEMFEIFNKLYDLRQTGGPMFEQYMRSAMLLVMEDPESGSTLMEIPKVLANPEFRKMKLSRNKNQVIHDFWTQEAEKAGGEASLANIVPYITSKLTQFTTNDIMRPIIGQQKSAINFREAMDSRKIILVNLPKGLLGEINCSLLGMIISSKIQIASFSRQNIPESERVPFYMYVDEFQDFTSPTFATILSQARKYNLSLNITNQYIAQLDDDMRAAVMGNVGTMLVWRIGAEDAEYMKKEFEPLGVDDMVNTEKFNFYMKMLIDGTPTLPFNATSYAPDPHENKEVGDALRKLSRLKYGRDAQLVESEIRLRSKNVV